VGKTYPQAAESYERREAIYCITGSCQIKLIPEAVGKRGIPEAVVLRHGCPQVNHVASITGAGIKRMD